jgi:hypothetical protein
MDPESDREQPSNSVVNYLTSAEKPIRVGNVNFYRVGLFTGKGYLQGRVICREGLFAFPHALKLGSATRI